MTCEAVDRQQRSETTADNLKLDQTSQASGEAPAASQTNKLHFAPEMFQLISQKIQMFLSF